MSYYIILCVLILALAGCAEPDTQQGQNQETAMSGKAEILCDETIYELLKPTFAMFDSAYPDAHITVKSVSAYEAYRSLLADSTRGVIVARTYVRTEDSLMKLFQVSRAVPDTLALDALVFFVRKDFPLDTISLEQLTSVIKDGTMLRSYFPQLKAEPVFVAPDVTSSVYGNVFNLITGNNPPKHSFQFESSMQDVRREVLNNENAIGVGYLSFYAADTANIRAIRIGFSDPERKYISPRPVHQSSVYMKTYPLSVPIQGIRSEDLRNTLPWGFLSFLSRNEQVQRHFLTAGIVPAFAKIKLVQPE